MDKNFLETFFKKVLDIWGEHVYNVPVATQQGERNKDKQETELSVRISKRKSRTAKKSSKKCLTKFQNSDKMGASQDKGMPHPTTKSDENANHQ